MTRRTIALAAALALVLIVAGGLYWAVRTSPRWASLGLVNNVDFDKPRRLVVTGADGQPVPLWIVPVSEGLRVFDARSRMKPECEIRWVPGNDQFWDLCSAWTLIWSRQGVLLSYPSPERAEITPYLLDLDRYPTRTRNFRLLANMSQPLQGAARTAPPTGYACRPFWDGVIWWSRCTITDL